MTKSALYDNNENVNVLLDALDRILNHGRRKGTSYWGYFEQLEKLDPSSTPSLNIIRQDIKRENERARGLLRIALNQRRLGEWMATLTSDTEHTRAWYEDYSVLRKEDLSLLFLTLLEGLKGLTFALCLNEEDVSRVAASSDSARTIPSVFSSSSYTPLISVAPPLPASTSFPTAEPSTARSAQSPTKKQKKIKRRVAVIEEMTTART